MRLLVIITFFISFQAFAAVDLTFGIGSGGLDFEDQRPSTKDEYSSFNIGFETNLRLYLDTGVRLGLTAGTGWFDMNLAKNVSDGSDNTFQNTYYGAFLSIGSDIRLNLDYYAGFDTKIMYAQERSSNIFSSDDMITGSGYGIGITNSQGSFFYEVMYRVFRPSQITFSETTLKVADEEITDFDFSIMSGLIGRTF